MRSPRPIVLCLAFLMLSGSLRAQTCASQLGDVNMDGFVDFADIPPFIAVLISDNFQAEADIDLSGRVNFADIPPFVEVLTSDALPTNQIVDGSATCVPLTERILVLGDSLLNGVASQGRIEASFASGGQTAEVTDLATGGFRISQVSNEWNAYKPNCTYHDRAVLMVGINDVINAGTVNPTTNDMEAALRALIDDLISSPCIGHLILLNYTPFGGNQFWNAANEQELQQLKAAVESYSGTPGVEVIDTFSLMAIAGTYPGPQPSLQPALANNDLLHWNRSAQNLVADAVRDTR